MLRRREEVGGLGTRRPGKSVQLGRGMRVKTVVEPAQVYRLLMLRTEKEDVRLGHHHGDGHKFHDG